MALYKQYNSLAPFRRRARLRRLVRMLLWLLGLLTVLALLAGAAFWFYTRFLTDMYLATISIAAGQVALQVVSQQG